MVYIVYRLYVKCKLSFFKIEHRGTLSNFPRYINIVYAIINFYVILEKIV